MNIFVLDASPCESARMMCDKHVVKMVLETAQLLSTAWNVIDPNHGMDLYKSTHMNHPCSLWVRETSMNYIWAYSHFAALCTEYTHRYGKTHKTQGMAFNLYKLPPIGGLEQTPFAICMPEKYKVTNDPVQSYRNYYNGDKAAFAKWTNREVPEWFKQPAFV